MNYVPSEDELSSMDFNEEIDPERINCKGCFYFISNDCGHGMAPPQTECAGWESE